jgi:hypothetical protein
MFFWVLASYRCKRFGETFCLHLQDETVCFSETLASTDESTRRQNPDHHHHLHRRENLISQKLPDLSVGRDKCIYNLVGKVLGNLSFVGQKYTGKFH